MSGGALSVEADSASANQLRNVDISSRPCWYQLSSMLTSIRMAGCRFRRAQSYDARKTQEEKH